MSRSFVINGREVADETNPFVIAEVGINHNGSLDIALQMIDVAKESGADAVKFQTFKAEEFCGDPNQEFTYISAGQQVTEPMLEMFIRYELEDSDWKKLKAHADSIGIIFFSTPQNVSDLELLLPLGIPAIKVGSDDLTNLSLIANYATRDLPLILSSGMADLGEVHKGLSAAGWYEGNQVAMLVCTSQYPTPSEDVNIMRIKTLQEAFPGLVVGFSDHTQGNEAAIMASALGARIFEKHFTLDHESEGPDHWFSLNPNELKSWVSAIRTSFTMRGTGIVLPTESELKMRELARRSPVAIQSIKAGQEISSTNTALRRAPGGIHPSSLESILGRLATRDIPAGHAVTWDHLK